MNVIKEMNNENTSKKIQKHEAATIICLKEISGRLNVLLGQNECINYLKSTISTNIIMRYPGEYKFPGGVVEKNETLQQTAIRELVEEFIGIRANDNNSNIHLFNRKETLPIQGKIYVMNNFIAFADENDWIEDDLVCIINSNLKARRDRFNDAITDNSYWTLSYEDKCKLSPEVNSVKWFRIEEAIEILESSERHPIEYANEFQEHEFLKYGIKNRDSMYQTKVTLQNIFRLSSKEKIINACEKK
jgi:8-oxo-dGTP pyrophosphatase MutT (NUDIX family)